jgi:peroxiredoxin Q/BCP
MPNVGDTAPDFELPNHDGTPVRLSDYRGTKVVLFVFTRTHTMTCGVQACAFRDEYGRLKAAGAEVFGVNNETPEGLKHWRAHHKLPYDLLSDVDHQFLEAWGAWGMSIASLIKLPVAVRSYWVIDENGLVIDGQVGVGPGESVQRALHTIEQMRRAV